MNEKYKMVKIVSGEIVLFESIEQATVGQYGMKNPLVVALQPDHKTGQLGVMMMPINPFAAKDDVLWTNKDNVIFEITNIPPQILERYIQMTTGIIVPQTGNKFDPKIISK